MITVYTTKTCPYCPMAKKYLAFKGMPYEEIDITNYSYDERRALGTHFTPLTLPVILFPDGTYLTGYNIGKIAKKVNELTKEFENATLFV